VQAVAFPRYRSAFVTILALAYWALLGWQHTHGGVPAHSLFARDDMPAISNWWGALLVPLLAWLATGLVLRRVRPLHHDPVLLNHVLRQVMVAFCAAFLYAMAMGLIFQIDRNSPVLSTLFFALPAIGLVLPIFRPEYVLGFVLGMMYTFGPVIPLLIASVLSVISAVAVLLLRPLVAAVVKRLRVHGPIGR
jgi:hypothetical protein